jgi:DNA-binding NtrC family response regulator
VGRALKHGGEQAQPEWSLANLGRAPLIMDLKQRLERVAALRTPVLLLGEPGCATEQCARFLHVRNTPWVAPDASAPIADAPLELLIQARDGTLFLRDVGDLNRVEQKGLALLLGKADRYNVRTICGATPQLADLVASGTFDAKVYATLAGTTIHVPSLREHREDVPELANLILLRLVEAKEVPPREFSTAALNALRNYEWPGNFLQLQATVRTLAQTALSDRIGVDDVERVLPRATSRVRPDDLPLDMPLRNARDAFERVYFEYHIAKEGGNISRVADSVGLERTHLYRKLKQLGIRLPRRLED